MRIAFVTSKKSLFRAAGIIPKLEKEIANCDAVEIVAETNLDVPAEVLRAEGFDLVVVLVYYQRSSPDVRAMVSKLADLEMQGRRTLKFIEKAGEDFEASESDEREIVDSVLERLFGKRPKKNGGEKESFTTL